MRNNKQDFLLIKFQIDYENYFLIMDKSKGRSSSAEQWSPKPCVVGSIPTDLGLFFVYENDRSTNRWILEKRIMGWISKTIFFGDKKFFTKRKKWMKNNISRMKKYFQCIQQHSVWSSESGFDLTRSLSSALTGSLIVLFSSTGSKISSIITKYFQRIRIWFMN